MKNSLEPQPSASIGLDDALYTIFRHKWKILFFTAVGLAAAAAIFLTEKTLYRSQAKLMVRYITDKQNPLLVDPTAKDAGAVRPVDPREVSVLAAEAEILRSTDSIIEAIKTVGVKKVLTAYKGGTNVNVAAGIVLRNLQVEIGKNGAGIMAITLSHRDQEVAQELLSALITRYQYRHLQIHHSGATYDQVLAQKEAIHSRLQETEADLQREKRAANISNLEQSKAELAMRTAETKRNIDLAEAELAQEKALLQERRGTTNALAETASTNAAPANAPSPMDIARYNLLARRLLTLRETEADWSLTFSDSSTKIQKIRQQIAETEEQLKKINLDPSYLNAQPANSLAPLRFDFEGARGRVASLQAKYAILTNQLANVRAEANKIERVENRIAQLERQRKMEEEEYAYYSRNLEEIKLAQTIDVTQRNNINVIQEASQIPPDNSPLVKKVAGASVGGIMVGLLLALLSDFIFNPSVKRRKELENSLHMPVLVTIPNFGGALKDKKAAKTKAVEKNGVSHHRNGEISPWEDRDPMLPYYEALRDRVVMSYANDTHKPKVVGLTSCNKGAGVSRIAEGLAASLSRDAKRHVLLVGLERNKVAVSAFAKGRPTNGITPPEEGSPSEQMVVAENLQSLVATGRNLAGASVVQSFSELMPQLKVCDYDYIVFDLPPLTQTSGALRLASQMERTLVVVEAEETSKEKVKRSRDLLNHSHANIYAVLNKVKSYGPKSVCEEV